MVHVADVHDFLVEFGMLAHGVSQKIIREGSSGGIQHFPSRITSAHRRRT
jgi:hypothetical protein